jgi:hypothetical protein
MRKEIKKAWPSKKEKPGFFDWPSISSMEC